ncbi:MAG: gas vesicle protein GvpN, partial [Planctomycetota bacterium]|nr:gas vesicle protein GvpN [Planctomycetota bacterium]
YLGAGFPVHLTGPAGTGKTCLALYVAAQIGRPVIIMHGDEELATGDMVGGNYGVRHTKVVDNFVHSVKKLDHTVENTWVDNRLTVACKYGLTLVYDEFTRSRAEANNALLSVLEEGVLDMPAGRGEQSFLRVHPNFRAIFTSNPSEYAGVHRAADALQDRMITIHLGHHDRETEIAITAGKSGIDKKSAAKIVDIVRAYRQTREAKVANYGICPTIRASVMIATVLKAYGAKPEFKDNNFVQLCHDVLGSSRWDEGASTTVVANVNSLIQKFAA